MQPRGHPRGQRGRSWHEANIHDLETCRYEMSLELLGRREVPGHLDLDSAPGRDGPQTRSDGSHTPMSAALTDKPAAGPQRAVHPDEHGLQSRNPVEHGIGKHRV